MTKSPIAIAPLVFAAGCLGLAAMPLRVTAAQATSAVRVEKLRCEYRIKPVKITEPRPGQCVFDLGQSMVGWCRLKVQGARGTKVTLRHGEMLNDDGTLYTANRRGRDVAQQPLRLDLWHD